MTESRSKKSEAEWRLSLIVLKALEFDVVYPLLCASQSLFLDKSKVHRYCISTNSFHPWIVSAEKMSYGGVFSANIWICYNLQIQKKKFQWKLFVEIRFVSFIVQWFFSEIELRLIDKHTFAMTRHQNIISL